MGRSHRSRTAAGRSQAAPARYEVVQPHDRAQRESRGHRAREGARSSLTSGQTHAGRRATRPRDESGLTHRRAKSERGGHARRSSSCSRTGCPRAAGRNRGTAEPVETDDRPRGERHDDTDGDRPERRADSTGRERPDEQRPEEELRRDGEAERDGRLATLVAIAPRDSQREAPAGSTRSRAARRSRPAPTAAQPRSSARRAMPRMRSVSQSIASIPAVDDQGDETDR